MLLGLTGAYIVVYAVDIPTMDEREKSFLFVWTHRGAKAMPTYQHRHVRAGLAEGPTGNGEHTQDSRSGTVCVGSADFTVINNSQVGQV